MSKPMIHAVVLLTLLATLAACKSTTQLPDASETADAAAMESTTMTPEPEVANSDTGSFDSNGSNESVFAQNESTPEPAAPVESLGASSSGLGR